MVAVLAAMTLPLTAAACSSSAAPADTAPSVPITESTPAPSTSATATTPASTEPTTGSTTVEDAIRAAHTRVMTELYRRDERLDGPEAMLPLAEELTTGPLLNRIRDAAAEHAASGERTSSPGFDSHVKDVTLVDQANALVLDCVLDRSELYSADGRLIQPADQAPVLIETEVVLVDGRWLVREINAGGAVNCDPDA